MNDELPDSAKAANKKRRADKKAAAKVAAGLDTKPSARATAAAKGGQAAETSAPAAAAPAGGASRPGAAPRPGAAARRSGAGGGGAAGAGAGGGAMKGRAAAKKAANRAGGQPGKGPGQGAGRPGGGAKAGAAARMRKAADLKNPFIAPGDATALPAPWVSALTQPLPAAATAPVPYIVWALRGSGGESVAAALGTLTGNALQWKNPFTETGSHAEVPGLFKRGGNEPARKRAVLNAIVDKPRIWHAVDEANDDQLNSMLVESSATTGYRHVLLYRRDTYVRLLSAHHEATGVGASDATAAAAAPLDRAAMLEGHLRSVSHLLLLQRLIAPQDALAVAVEDLGGAPAGTGRPDGAALLSFLGLAAAGAARDTALAALAAVRGEAPMAALSKVPGAAELRTDLLWVPGFEEGVAFVKPTVKSLASWKGEPVFRADRMPVWVCAGTNFRFGGVAVPPDGFEPDEQTRFVVSQGKREQAAAWGRPSQAVQQAFPGHPHAAQSRFAMIGVRASTRAPAIVGLRRGDGRRVDVAELGFEHDPSREVMDGIFVAQWSIGYRPIPKVASTSVRNGLYKLGMGQYYAEEGGGASWRVHQYFRDRHADISGAKFRFAVVRDPIKRFLSGYSNRVVASKELSKDFIAKLPNAGELDLANFPYDPSLSEFIRNFDFYQCVPTIAHHFRPQVEFVISRDRFDELYPIEQLDRLQRDIEARCGRPLELRKEMTGGPKLTVDDLTPAEFLRLCEMYAGDYALLAPTYDPDALKHGSRHQAP